MPGFPQSSYPTDDASYVQALKSERSMIMAEILTERQARLTAGGTKTSYTLDGQQVGWDVWESGMQAKKEKLDAQIQMMDQPYELFTRGYT